MSFSEAAIYEAAEEEVLIPSLPNDVALNCLARVPRSKHLTLSLVSKPIRSLISSPLFFNVRSSIPHSTEPILYLVLDDYRSKSYRWLILYRNPFNSPIDSDLLVPIPVPSVPSSTSLHHAAYAVLGTNIYVIGGTKHFGLHSSSEVWVLDCRINSWRRGPTMLADRNAPVATVLDGKIYVIGGSHDSSIQAEVLDAELGKWVEFVCPFTIDRQTCFTITVRKKRNPTFVKDDKLYIYENEKGNHVSVFDPREGSWSRTEMPKYPGSLFVDGIFYYCNSRGGIIRWCDAKEDGVWKDLKYLDNKLVFPMSDCESRYYCALTYAAGNLVLLGGKMSQEGKNNNEILYSEIKVTKKDGELWGTVCRSQIILSTPPDTFRVQQCLAVDL